MQPTIFISTAGDDCTGDGTIEHPFATPQRGLEESRFHPNPCTVHLEKGVYYCKTPLVITAADSGLTLSGSNAVMSGAKTLGRLNWTPLENGIWCVPVSCGAFDRMYADGAEQTLCRYPNRVPGRVPLEGAAAPAEIKQRTAKYQDPSGGFIRAIHEAEWGGNSYLITGKDPASSCGLRLEWVGDNNRGNRYGKAMVIENVKEELDAPTEWFYDGDTLFWYPPECVDPGEAVISVSTVTELLILSGESAAQPVTNITIKGICFEKTGRTLFPTQPGSKTYEPLLRGDWCVVRSGAVYWENAKNCVLENCEFSFLGGNGVFLSGYQEGHRITGSNFEQLGATAIQIIGLPSAVRQPSYWEHALYPALPVHRTAVANPELKGPQGEDYPRDVEICQNHIGAVGLLEKQSAGINLSVSSRIRILHNTIHDSARSLINVNDGTFGGHEIGYNDLFDAQRETADHGPFNSWGRDRYWSVPSYNAAGKWGKKLRAYEQDGQIWDITGIDAYQTTRIHHNRFHHPADSTHSWGIDLDDGSTNYEIDHNLVLGIGIKLREGFDRNVHHNLLADGQLQIHVPYEGCRDHIYQNMILHSSPIGLAGCTARRFRESGISMEQNLVYAGGRKLKTPPFIRGIKVLDGTEPAENGFPGLPEEWTKLLNAEYGQSCCVHHAPDFCPAYGAGESLSSFWMLGAKCCNVTQAIRSATALPDCDGAYVKKILPFSQASAFGLRPGDVIRTVDGAPASGAVKGRARELTIWRESQLTQRKR